MTVRDLMLHTAGLTYGAGPDALKEAFGRLKPLESTDLKEMTDKLAQIPLAFDPGTDWTYSVAIDVLGRVIEVASGETLDVFLRKTIFEPLDMPDTAFNVPPEKLARFAANYSRSTGGLKVIDVARQIQVRQESDLLLRWRRPGVNGQGLPALPHHDSKRRRARRTSDSPSGDGRAHDDQPASQRSLPHSLRQGSRHGTGFGFGFSVRTENTNWDPAGRVGEYGWGGAASTHYWVSPADKLIVVTLEQIMPYQWDTEFGVKKIIYDAINN